MNKFDDLPKDAQERIRVRNAFSDELADVQDSSRKADFLTQMLKGHFMDEIPTAENQWIWVHNREHICMFVNIIQDYTFMVQKELTRIEDQITEMNVADGWGGGKRCQTSNVTYWRPWWNCQRQKATTWN